MILVAAHAGVATLTLNCPERGNALSPGLVDALTGHVKQCIADATLHTLVLCGNGRNFCTGLDLSDLVTASDADFLLRLVRIEELLSLLWQAPIRTVALASGRTWGAGADLFVACEHRVAAPDTTFRFPGAQFGIVLGTRRLAERVGSDMARRWVLEGAELDAHQAHSSGLASGIGDSPDLVGPAVEPATARLIRHATRADMRDADLAALVRSASVPGLQARIARFRERLLARNEPRPTHRP